jgi:hypothetical protein
MFSFPNIGHCALCRREHNSLLEEEMPMNKIRFAKPVAVAAGFLFLCVAPWMPRAQGGSPSPTQALNLGSSGTQSKRDSAPPDDFSGLTLTDDQKAEIDKIHRETKLHQEVVYQDEKLTADQKQAMIEGYSRIAYGQIYRQLTPEQKRRVQQRIRARRADDEAAKKPHPSTK